MMFYLLSNSVMFFVDTSSYPTSVYTVVDANASLSQRTEFYSPPPRGCVSMSPTYE